mmetsp:Transcript_2194/g.5456  ORF Transcript_2194/g.5456 Transcript_2194/m.5456 type:complete len:751 (-) Transcript_2194:113-2365(-)
MGEHCRFSVDRSSATKTELVRAHGLAGCKSRVLSAFKKSKLPDKTVDLPRFDIGELELGALLGTGQFGTISEVKAFHIEPVGSCTESLSDDDDSGKFSYGFSDDSSMFGSNDGDEQEMNNLDIEARAFLSRHALKKDDTKRSRYAVKVLSPNVMCDTESFLQGISDMAVETRILSNMDHPNIMKLRAHAKVEPYNEYYFIVMDRLYDSLDDRLAQWEKRSRGNLISRLQKKESSALLQVRKEKFQVAYDLAHALCYVHKMNIVYRDIKSENVGFDIRNDVRLFDFGLSRELLSSQKDASGTYKMTQLGIGLEGNPRYIAPEVANGEPYNKSCDSYSFAVLVWQIMSCQTPNEEHDLKSFKEKVWAESVHERPPVDEKWPLPIRLLLTRSWAHNWHERGSMESICEILRQEVVAVRNGDESSLDHVRRRSTHIFDRETHLADELDPELYKQKQAVDGRAAGCGSMNSAKSRRGSMNSAKPRRGSMNSAKSLGGSMNSTMSLRGSMNSTKSAASERREERHRKFAEEFQSQCSPGEKTSAERQVRRSSLGNFGENSLGGVHLPAGAVAASQIEDFADSVHATDRVTVTRGSLRKQNSSLALQKQDSSRSLLRKEKSSRSLSKEKSSRSLRKEKSSRSLRQEKSSRSLSTQESSSSPISNSLHKQESSRSLRKTQKKKRRSSLNSSSSSKSSNKSANKKDPQQQQPPPPISTQGCSSSKKRDEKQQRASRGKLKAKELECADYDFSDSYDVLL